jgi:hypothetical protein
MVEERERTGETGNRRPETGDRKLDTGTGEERAETRNGRRLLALIFGGGEARRALFSHPSGCWTRSGAPAMTWIQKAQISLTIGMPAAVLGDFWSNG